MSNNLLCISSQDASNGCVLEKTLNGLEIIFITPSISERILTLVQEFKEKGVRVRQEDFLPGQININRVEITPDDPRYLTGCAEEFAQLGWKTFIYSTEKAQIWRKLYELSVPNDLRITFGERLNVLSQEALQELNEILDRAEKRASSK